GNRHVLNRAADRITHALAGAVQNARTFAQPATRAVLVLEDMMKRRSALKSSALGLLCSIMLAATSSAESGPGTPWRGAGPQPCFGPEGGAYQCRQDSGLVAVRAGRLFDSRSGQMLTDQVVLILGERITEVGGASQIRIPGDAQVIDLGRETVLPGLIDAHTHMFNYPKRGVSRETSTLIAVHNLQADLYAGFTAARDMSSHDNGYADVEIRDAIDQGRLDGPRFQVSGRGIRWGGTTPGAKPGNPLAALLVHSIEEAPAAVTALAAPSSAGGIVVTGTPQTVWSWSQSTKCGGGDDFPDVPARPFL